MSINKETRSWSEHIHHRWEQDKNDKPVPMMGLFKTTITIPAHPIKKRGKRYRNKRIESTPQVLELYNKLKEDTEWQVKNL